MPTKAAKLTASSTALRSMTTGQWATVPMAVAPAIPMPQLGLDRVACDDSAPSARAEFPSPVRVPAAVTPLSPTRFKVQVSTSGVLRDQIERLQALTREDLATAWLERRLTGGVING